MPLAYLTLFAGLAISAVAEYYSIMGLIAIYPAALWSIVIMGVALGLGKLIGTVWLKQNWANAPAFLKTYLLPAVILLMLITSIGVFGFLSKAHSDQGLVSGDVQAKIAVYDEKIKTAKDNIDANRRALKQMDEAVDQVMSRSTTEGGADKAVQIRKGQQKERARLLAEISSEQKTVASVSEARAPIAAEVRKVEAEVGPIKYIAAFIYGDNPDANLLEKAVTWVSILIVVVLDPLAVILLLASQYSFEYERKKRKSQEEEYFVKDNHPIDATDLYEPDDGALTDEQVELIRTMVKNDLPTGEVVSKQSLFEDPEADEELPMVKKRFAGFPFPMGSLSGMTKEKDIPDPLAHIDVPEIDPEDQLHALAKQAFLAQQPDTDERVFYAQHQEGEIDHLPWHNVDHINNLPISDGERKQLINRFGLEADNVQNKTTGVVRGFGTQFPTNVNKGDMFLRVDQLPSLLYKFNGNQWIEVDKTSSDQYAYDDAYIDHLIEKIDTGEYDPDLLSNAERDSIERRLSKV